MNKLYAGLAIAVAIGANAAVAADFTPMGAPTPFYAPAPTWMGLYVGANLGGGWAAGGQDSILPYADPTLPIGGGNFYLLPGGGNTASNTGGVVGGGQIGYNFQFRPSILVGAEADIQGTSLGGGDAGNTIAAYPSPVTPGNLLVPLASGDGGRLSLPWFGSVRGRAGWLVTPTFLLYGTAGFAYGEVSSDNLSNTRTGWTAGGGVEWMFMPNWSAKAEYLYMDLASGGVTGGFGWDYGYHRHPQANIIRLGVNYHFNGGGGSAPIVAGY